MIPLSQKNAKNGAPPHPFDVESGPVQMDPAGEDYTRWVVAKIVRRAKV
jgi:hypothetical protein